MLFEKQGPNSVPGHMQLHAARVNINKEVTNKMSDSHLRSFWQEKVSYADSIVPIEN